MRLASFNVHVVAYLINDVLPAVADAIQQIGLAMAEAFARGLVGIPVAIYNALEEPLKRARAGQSKFVGDTKIDWDSIQNLIKEGARNAAIDLDTMRIGGLNVKDAFKQIAEQSPNTASAIIKAMKDAGIDTKIYEDVLKDVKTAHDKVGQSAKDAYEEAKTKARGYRDTLDLLLGKLGEVSGAHDRLVLTLDAVDRQLKNNATSTDSLAVQQAKLHLAQQDVISSGSNLVEIVAKQGVSFGNNREKVNDAINQLQDFKNKNPEVAGSVQLIIDKLQALQNQPDITKNVNVVTSYTIRCSHTVGTGENIKDIRGDNYGSTAPSGSGPGSSSEPLQPVGPSPSSDTQILPPSSSGPTYDQFAIGGFVNGPTLALIGEAGRELVLPLTDHRRTMQLLMASGLVRAYANGGGAGWNGNSDAITQLLHYIAPAETSMPDGLSISPDSNSGFGSNATTMTNTFIINGAQDPQATAMEVKKQLYQLLQEIRVRN